MQPRSLSASALTVANLCLSRYGAEHITRGRGPSGVAALGGTAVHNALELFVVSCYIKKEQQPTLKLLLDLYDITYMQTFGTGDTDTEEHSEGVEMLKAWFKRTDFSTFSVISAEVKETFPVKTSIGDIPFNFIWDRHDRLSVDGSDDEVRVVDYKTNRWPYSPQDLKKLPQARAYGLAAQFKYPQAKRIWVEFDMLRHQGPVGVSFSTEENRATYKWIKNEAERIIATELDKAPETVNAQCNFCVRKAECGAFKRAVQAGHALKFTTAGEAIARRAELEFVQKAVTSALKEIDELIFTESQTLDVFEWQDDAFTMEIGQTKGRRQIDADRAEMVVGSEVMRKYGGQSLTIGNLEKMLKSDDITDEQKKRLRGLIDTPPGNPKIIVKPKTTFDDEF